jgi:hypothetical protein
MGAVTRLVRRALAELGPDATLREVTDYIHARDATVARSCISLAMRNVRSRHLGSERKKQTGCPLQ